MSQLLTPTFPDYELIDSGDFEKLERFGRHVTRRPEPQAIWHKTLSEEENEEVEAVAAKWREEHKEELQELFF